MSNDSQTQLPDSNEAFNVVFDIHQRAFFGKLASLGIEPENEKQAANLLDMAAKLRGVPMQLDKEAEQEDPYEQANSALETTLYGRTQVAAKTAASQLAQDPAVYNAVLALKGAEASAYAEQVGFKPEPEEESK